MLPIKGAISVLEPKVDNLPSWLTFKKEAGKLIFTAAPMTEVCREATVTITLGTVYKQAVKFVQSYGPLGYDFLVGKYRMQGIRFYKDANVDMEVELVKSPDLWTPGQQGGWDPSRAIPLRRCLGGKLPR